MNDGLYIRETARSIGERLGEHLNTYEIKDKNSVFHKQIEDKDVGERQEVQLKVVSFSSNDAILRQVTEAILIEELNPELKPR